MSSFKTPYPNAPITEAVIDLRVEVSPEVSVVDLAKVQKGEESSYPTVEIVNEGEFKLVLGPQAVANTSTQHVGFLFRSGDGKHIHQARMNGFTMSRLAPYPRWEDFCPEARRLWGIYRSVAKPSKITRVAVRYVNRIDIPVPFNDFEQYLRTVPVVSPDLPQGLSGYFMRLVMPLEDLFGSAIVTETLVEPASPNVVSIVLDIDVFRTYELPSTEDEIWALIEQLRDAKNKVFEGCITDEARKLFQ